MLSGAPVIPKNGNGEMRGGNGEMRGGQCLWGEVGRERGLGAKAEPGHPLPSGPAPAARLL